MSMQQSRTKPFSRGIPNYNTGETLSAESSHEAVITLNQQLQ
jgi:hypothetical protein